MLGLKEKHMIKLMDKLLKKKGKTETERKEILERFKQACLDPRLDKYRNAKVGANQDLSEYQTTINQLILEKCPELMEI